MGILFAALVGAIVWNLITWYFGLPSSSSHALFGGMVGAALAGSTTVYWQGVVDKIVIPMFVSPVIGLLAGYLVMTAIMWIFRRSNPHKAKRGFRIAQTVSAAGMALGHGLQDAQKTMGIVVMALVIADVEDYGDPIPVWVKIACALMLSAGTYAGGWRIMRTLGRKIIELDPPQGVRRGDHGRLDHVRVGVPVPRADLDDACHHVVDHGCGGDEAGERRAVGCRAEHHHGVVHHDAGGCGGCRVFVLGCESGVPVARPVQAPASDGPAPEPGGGPLCSSRWHRHAAPRGDRVRV